MAEGKPANGQGWTVAELEVELRRFEQELRPPRLNHPDVCPAQPDFPPLATGRLWADIALAGDPQGRTMGRAAADEKPGCDQAKHSPTAIRHDLTITTGDSGTR